MVAELIFGFLIDQAADAVKSRGGAILKKRDAARELAAIGEKAVMVASNVAPDLGPDLQSKSFLEGVVGPMLKTIVENPATLLGSDDAAAKFIDMFVVRFNRDESADETLMRVFKTERATLDAAFAAMLADLRRQLFASAHWKGIGLYQSTEEMRSDVSIIRNIVEELIHPIGPQVDLDAAREDAHAGSSELRDWPKDIEGEEIHRPELKRLLAHLKANASGTSLLIGDAGSGKSALLADLTSKLEAEGLTVFALKADVIPPIVTTIDAIGVAMGMKGSLELEIEALAKTGRVILLIDQLDAVSDVMDRSSARMQLLLRLVRQLRDKPLPIHVLVSSRPFEAAHDARFAQLKAEEFSLALPPLERVNELLTALDIKTDGVDPALLQTIRRPFALKLFVELARRGVDVKSIQSGALLDVWLASAKLGSDSERADVLALMERLAGEMIETETLWRPADRFADAAAALARAEASGLVVRSGVKIGFSHQSWLDDFQAKGFRTGKELSEYAWRNQDSLFVRATLLRSLQRLRAVDEDAYGSTVKLLLFDAKTRRHLKHLIVDVVTAQVGPLPAEIAWVDTVIRSDPILANRALGNVAARWDGWRDGLKAQLPKLMAQENYHWRSIQLLAAEASHDPDGVADLITSLWDDPKYDGTVFRVLEQAGALTPKIEAIFQAIVNRSPVDQYGVSHFATALAAEHRFEEAGRIVAMWAKTLPAGRSSAPHFHGVDKLAKDGPFEFASAMLPWLVSLATEKVESYRDGVHRYPKSESMPWDWDFERGADSLIAAIRNALKQLACETPDDARKLLDPLLGEENEEVQDLIAQTYAAGSANLAKDAYAFLVADERRFQIGDAHVTLRPGLSGSEPGLTSQELIEAIAPHLSMEQLLTLRDRIEAWSAYGPEFAKDAEPELKRRKHRWIDEHRLALLERLPPDLLTPARRRQIAEWRKEHPRPLRRAGAAEMASFVGSPMSSEAMVKAPDDAILNMLDEIDDVTPRRPGIRRISLDGGVTELSRAFAAFGKQQPDRALNLAATRLVSGRHETVAGELVHVLARESENVEPAKLVMLIHNLTAKGFNSEGWRRDCAWALGAIAPKMGGLDDKTIDLLLSWLDNDPEQIAGQVEGRLQNDAINSERSTDKREAVDAMLFDRNHGAGVLPQNNYSILAAIFQGLMSRKVRDYDRWLAILEAQAGKPEDPKIWTTIFLFEGRFLFWADRQRTTALLDRLFASDPSIFDDMNLLGVIWSTRAMFSTGLIVKIVERWLASPDEATRQGAAEFIQAGLLADPDSELFADLGNLLDENAPELLNGRLFSAAAAWREDDSILRPAAHAVLMKYAPAASGDAAHAISFAVDRTDRLLPDSMTTELLGAVGANPELLAKSLNGRFADGLQGLLLYPGFDEAVLEITGRVADLITDNKAGQHRGLMDEDFVQVTVALQRSDGPLRGKAMDVYEQLLDAGAYGAEQAAKAAAGR